MMSLNEMALAVLAVGSIGGGAIALDIRHVASAEFEQYVEQQLMSDERDYVLQLKKDIRDLRGALVESPDAEYLVDALADMINELCEIRPDDRECESE